MTPTAFVDSVLLFLSGYTLNQDKSTHLTSALTADGLVMQVQDGSAVTVGICEIDDELVWIQSVDPNAGSATIAPYGRSYAGSGASAHSVNARVTSTPLYPRYVVKQAVNEAILSTYPTLFRVGDTTFTYQAGIGTYSLPAEADRVLSVSYRTLTPDRTWVPSRSYRYSKNPDGVTLSLYDTPYSGGTVHVSYAAAPKRLLDTDTDFTACGLPSSCEDLIRLGAAMRLLTFSDTPNISLGTAEADFAAANQGQVGGGTSVSRFMLQMYQLRLQEEARSLQEKNPVRSHYTI